MISQVIKGALAAIARGLAKLESDLIVDGQKGKVLVGTGWLTYF